MPERSCVTDYPAKGVMRAVWSGILQSDTCSELVAPQYPSKTIQVSGTFGAGGTIQPHGSNTSGGSFAQLNDPSGAAIALTNTAVEIIGENPLAVKPVLSGGDGTTSLTVTIIGRSEA
jgi:hypothetical protein